MLQWLRMSDGTKNKMKKGMCDEEGVDIREGGRGVKL